MVELDKKPNAKRPLNSLIKDVAELKIIISIDGLVATAFDSNSERWYRVATGDLMVDEKTEKEVTIKIEEAYKSVEKPIKQALREKMREISLLNN
jgi:hypothetical protein